MKGKLGRKNLIILMALGFVVALGLFLTFSDDAAVQLLVVVLAASYYVFLGSFYHFRHGDLSWKIFWEYLLVAILAILIYTWTLFA